MLGRGEGLRARVEALHGRGEVSLRFDPGVDPYAEGQAPLPPHIRREGDEDTDADLARYQTVYAREPGAIAAPTAGLHFTPSLLESLAARGIERAEVVLHVGAGTFRPLDGEAMKSESPPRGDLRSAAGNRRRDRSDPGPWRSGGGTQEQTLDFLDCRL